MARTAADIIQEAYGLLVAHWGNDGYTLRDDVDYQPGLNQIRDMRRWLEANTGDFAPKQIGKEGAGYIRLIVGPGPTKEYCYLCGCPKSGWVNMPNLIETDCEDDVCLCHSAERIR